MALITITVAIAILMSTSLSLLLPLPLAAAAAAAAVVVVAVPAAETTAMTILPGQRRALSLHSCCGPCLRCSRCRSLVSCAVGVTEGCRTYDQDLTELVCRAACIAIVVQALRVDDHTCHKVRNIRQKSKTSNTSKSKSISKKSSDKHKSSSNSGSHIRGSRNNNHNSH